MILNNARCDKIPELPKELMELIKKNKNNNNEESFIISIAETVCKYDLCIKDFEYRNAPDVPTEYQMFLNMDNDKKKEFKSSPKYIEFLKLEPIAKYLDSKEYIISINTRNKHTLSSWLKLNISKSARIKIESALDTYSNKSIKSPTSFNLWNTNKTIDNPNWHE